MRLIQSPIDPSLSPAFQRYRRQILKILSKRFNLTIPEKENFVNLSVDEKMKTLKNTGPAHPLFVAELLFNNNRVLEALHLLEDTNSVALKGIKPYLEFHIGKYAYHLQDFKKALKMFGGLYLHRSFYGFNELLTVYYLKTLYAVKDYQTISEIQGSISISGYTNIEYLKSHYRIKIRTLLHFKKFDQLVETIDSLSKDYNFLDEIFPDFKKYQKELKLARVELARLELGKKSLGGLKEEKVDFKTQLMVAQEDITSRDWKQAKEKLDDLRKRTKSLSKKAAKQFRCQLLQMQNKVDAGSRTKTKQIKTIVQLRKKCSRKYNKEEMASLIFDQGRLSWNVGDKKEAEKLFKQVTQKYKQTKTAPKASYTLAHLYQNDNKFKEAAKWFSIHNEKYSDSEFAEDSKFHQGFSYYLARDFNKALTVFTSEEDLPKFLFWKAKCYIQLGKSKQAKKVLLTLTKDHSFHYYGVRAYMMLDKLDETVSSFYSSIKFDYSLKPRPKRITPYNLRHLQTAEQLLSSGFYEYARRELIKIDAGKEPGFVVYLSMLNYIAGNFIQSVMLFNQVLKEDDTLPTDFVVLNYPVRFSKLISKFADRNNLETEFVLSLTRQESCFDSAARSPANALGLMQLIPETAKKMAKDIKSDYFKSDERSIYTLAKELLNNNYDQHLFRPDLNVAIGTKHLGELFDQIPVKTLGIAMYNAGKTPVNKWVKQFGLADMDLFIERVPYNETRNYIKIVVRNYFNYQRLLKGKVVQNMFASDFRDKGLF